MAEDLLDLIDTGSLNESVVKRNQNKVEEVATKALAADTNQDAANAIAKVRSNADIQKSADLAEIGFRQQVNTVNEALQQEIRGASQTTDAFRTQYEETFSKYQAAVEVNAKTSFWSNPIAAIRNSVVEDKLKNQLNTVTRAINAGSSHIDDAYARAAQKVNNYRATVVNLNQAELMAKAHEVQSGYDQANIANQAKTKIDMLTLDASRRQQFKSDDPYDKAKTTEERAVMEDQVLRYKWKVTNNYVDVPYTVEAAKLMKQTLDAAPKEEYNIWANAAARNLTSAPTPRMDGETQEQHSQRLLRIDIGRAGEVDGPQFARVVSGATNTVFNPLFKLADQEIEATLGTVDYEGWALAHGVTGGAMMLKPEQIKLAQQEQRVKVAQISQPQRISMAGNAIGRDMTLTATKSTMPPFKFAEAATLMQASGASQRAVEFFGTEEARLAIETPAYITGDVKKDTVFSIYEALAAKKLPSSQISQIIATYVDATYKADYSINGERAAEYQGLQQLMPGSDINYQVPVTHRDAAGKSKTFNLRNPVDINNLVERQRASEGARGRALQREQEIRAMSPIGNFIGNQVDKLEGR